MNSLIGIKFALIYKSDYLLGITVSDLSADVLLPCGMLMCITTSVMCNIFALRSTGFILRIILLNLSMSILLMYAVSLNVNAKLFKLRAGVLDRHKRAARSKILRRVFRGCRVYRLRVGSFHDVDYTFLLILITLVINYTVTLLIAFK